MWYILDRRSIVFPQEEHCDPLQIKKYWIVSQGRLQTNSQLLV